mmetsp:Transcript_7169/g.25236  ORF Transcript_7169/g.25236 Transcript_7169/m.25236 type:complete len:598 (-) Transcript_7169:255-2048(-)
MSRWALSVRRRNLSYTRRSQERLTATLLLAAIATVVFAAYAHNGVSETLGLPRRRLLSGGACEDSYPDWEKNGGVIVYFIGVLYMFIGIAIVCDDFFVPSLEKISEVLELSDDVAGATFMAAGSSAPELFSSAMSLVSPSSENELGVGTIVGSAVFNILVIIGGTAVFAGQTLVLDWKPLTRDALFYSAAIVTTFIIFSDNKVHWYEGLVSVILYIGYIVFMKFNAGIMAKVDKWQRTRSMRVASLPAAQASSAADEVDQKKFAPTPEPQESGGAPPDVEMGAVEDFPVADRKLSSHADSFATAVLTMRSINKWRKLQAEESPAFLSKGQIRAIRIEMEASAKLAEARTRRASRILQQQELSKAVEAAKPAEPAADAKAGEGDDDDDDGPGPFEVPEELKDYPMWLLSLPWYAFMTVTIPPCAEEKWEKWYLVSFGMSILWIAGISLLLVDWCARIGCILDIPLVVMGTTVLAAGTSIPDALSSLSVAKDGLANMAVANAVGSNVFDIWLGLGLPWLVYLPTQDPMYNVVNTDELIPSIIILFGVLVFYYGIVMVRGWKIDVAVGKAFCALYVVYAIYNIVLVWIVDIYGLSDDDDK